MRRLGGRLTRRRRLQQRWGAGAVPGARLPPLLASAEAKVHGPQHHPLLQVLELAVQEAVEDARFEKSASLAGGAEYRAWSTQGWVSKLLGC